MGSYYDDPDFAAEYERRDAEALDAEVAGRELASELPPRHLLEVWCLSCAHAHIPTIPVVTYRCNGAEGQGEPHVGCGYGGWYPEEAARHADESPGHVVYPVFHRCVPLEEEPAEHDHGGPDSRCEACKPLADALRARVRWPSLHWGELHDDAYPSLARAVHEAGLVS